MASENLPPPFEILTPGNKSLEDSTLLAYFDMTAVTNVRPLDVCSGVFRISKKGANSRWPLVLTQRGGGGANQVNKFCQRGHGRFGQGVNTLLDVCIMRVNIGYSI